MHGDTVLDTGVVKSEPFTSGKPSPSLAGLRLDVSTTLNGCASMGGLAGADQRACGCQAWRGASSSPGPNSSSFWSL